MTKKQEKELVDRLNKTQKLLKQFGLDAYAYDPGVLCVPSELAGSPRYNATINFGDNEWKWLEPLLRELSLARFRLRTKSRK